ncbi:MAG: hypothetical protein FJ303_00865 [Planctomycetes bacterium]|nr:hypothetical protein [Planctomycetota bacterium]
MSHRIVLVVVAVLIGLGALVAKPIRPPEPPDFGKVKEESIKKWAGAEVLLLGKLTQVIAGPVGLSNPPLRTYRMTITPEKVLRGSAKLDKAFVANYSVRQDAEPKFPQPDAECVVALKFVQNSWILQSVEQVAGENVEQAKLATSFPLGWTLKQGNLVSPWASVGKPGQPKGIACSVTGRPVLPAGDAVRFSVEPAPPAVKLKYGNPDGDGEYKMIVKNESDLEIEVPALLTDGKSIRWEESIVIRCQDKPYPVPGSTGDVKSLKSVILKPGETVSGTLHAFALNGPEWPRGGYRIEFQFCLAEKSATHSFYYLSKHHDPIRDAVQKKLKK